MDNSEHPLHETVRKTVSSVRGSFNFAVEQTATRNPAVAIYNSSLKNLERFKLEKHLFSIWDQ